MFKSDRTTVLYFALFIFAVLVVYKVAKNNGFIEGFTSDERELNALPADNRKPDDMSNDLVDNLVAQYTISESSKGTGSFEPRDPMADNHGVFAEYVKKKQINMEKMEKPFSNDSSDPRNFSYKKKNFTLKTPDEITDLLNSNNLLPHEINDWFDVTPLQTTQKIQGTHLMHPKVHMGVNTVGSSGKNGTHDIRGDIPNPKIDGILWNYSTIEPDTNIRGICNPI